MSDAEAVVQEGRRFAFIWLVPVVAALIGVWMVIYTIQSQGPEIEIVFETAEGIEADKTKVKLREVQIGLVSGVRLGPDNTTVVVTAQIEKEASSLLREDTEFWVVRPRIGADGISGLGTLLSGGYLQLAPGTGEIGRREFVGREDPPVTPAGTPGLRVKLESATAGSVGTGSPILYKGFRVGRVETAEFDVENRNMRYEAFIEAPYDDLVSSTTRFWNASGISVSAGANGVDVEMASIESLLQGGVAMGRPDGIQRGGPVDPDEIFEIYPSHKAVNERPYRRGIEYVLRFSQSLRGLDAGAPVEFRGIPIGRVERILIGTGIRDDDLRIPVVIRLEPGRITLPDTEAGVAQMKGSVEELTALGMRGSLATGNLLSGSLYVTFDIFKSEAPGEIEEFDGWATLPTTETGIGGVVRRVATLLDKVNELPLEEILEKVDGALQEVNGLLASDGVQELPVTLNDTLAELQGTLSSVSADSPLQGQLQGTLGELDRTLSSLRTLLDTLDEQPNAILFNRDLGEDPRPPAGSQ